MLGPEAQQEQGTPGPAPWPSPSEEVGLEGQGAQSWEEPRKLWELRGGAGPAWGTGQASCSRRLGPESYGGMWGVLARLREGQEEEVLPVEGITL